MEPGAQFPSVELVLLVSENIPICIISEHNSDHANVFCDGGRKFLGVEEESSISRDCDNCFIMASDFRT